MTRRMSLALLGAGIAGALAAPASSLPLLSSPNARMGAALVLSGGGARGAYEAGVVEGLARAAGVSDGERLPGVDVVVGTSIGAINGWFVATAQYSKLRAAWSTIADADLFRLKRGYATLANPSAGVITRIAQSVSLLSNLNRSMGGIFDADPIRSWISAHTEPDRPTVVPFVFNAADIRNVRAGYFYYGDGASDDSQQQRFILQALGAISGMKASARPASPILHDALYASIALPLLLDPIDIIVDGVSGLFVDGGSSDNTAIDIARVLAKRINTVLVDSAQPTFAPSNAIAAGLGSFNLLQQRVLEASMKSAYTTTFEKRLLAQAHLEEQQRAYVDGLYDVDLRIVRPRVELPAGVGDFHDRAKIAASYACGVSDAATAWQPYEPRA